MANKTSDIGETPKKYPPTSTGDEVTDRRARREASKARLEKLGSQFDKEPLVIDRQQFADPNTVWTCDRLQMMADEYLVDAIAADDDFIFIVHLTLSNMFQQAHDAQCTTPP